MLYTWMIDNYNSDFWFYFLRFKSETDWIVSSVKIAGDVDTVTEKCWM